MKAIPLDVASIPGPHRRLAGALALLLVSASCVPGAVSQGPVTAAASISIELPPIETLTVEPAPASVIAPAVPAGKAAALNAALPMSKLPNPAARSAVFRARTPIDRMRAVDCLAQAVYYEAASEGEAGQRAVAQVVLNRVRHPAYPNSVCGVVYQGPMRAGGGCQFTFTCDGSLARRPSDLAWARARRIAAEAIAGKVFAPVGHATHYHTQAVYPHWAPSLAKVGVIGAHIFYRFGNGWGEPAAFRAAYAGAEPIARPAKLAAAPSLPAPKLPIARAAFIEPLAAPAATREFAALAADESVAAPAAEEQALPPSTIRPEFARTGRPREVPLD